MTTEEKGRASLPQEVFEDMQDVVDKAKVAMATSTYMALKMPHRDFKALKAEFGNADGAVNGKVSTDEFKRCLSVAQLKAPPNLVDMLVKELDTENTGSIPYQQFMDYCFLS